MNNHKKYNGSTPANSDRTHITTTQFRQDKKKKKKNY